MTIASLETLRNRAAKRSESQARAVHSLPCRQMPAKPGTRVLALALDSGASAEISIANEDAEPLIVDGLLYECCDGLHDLHLEPVRLWTVEDVARIVAAAAKPSGAAQ